MFEKGQKRLLIALSLIFIAFVTICIYIYQNREALKKEAFVEPDFDKNIVEGIPSGLDKEWNYSSLEIQKGKNLALCATPVMNEKDLQLYLTSDFDNDFWLKVRVLDKKKQVLGECGLLKPGSYVKNIRLTKNVKSGKKLTLYLMMYEKGSYQSAGSATIGIVVL